MYRSPFTTQDAYEQGWTHSGLRHAVRTNSIQRVAHGVYLAGAETPTSIETALARAYLVDGIVSGTLAGVLYELDGIRLGKKLITIPADADSRRTVRRSDIPPEQIAELHDYQSTNALRTLIDLANIVNDIVWEQALESALRKELVTVDELMSSIYRKRGAKRVRRVLALRPPNAAPTGSILETMMVQLIRRNPKLPAPERQVVVHNKWGGFVARVDLAWPDLGVFLELDGQQHTGQPVYDARRETAVVAAKRWYPGRFTWDEVTRIPQQTLWRVTEILEPALSTKST